MAQITQIVPNPVAPTIAQQAYIIGSGLAQAGSNMILAKGLADYPQVSRDDLAFAIFVSAILTFVPVMILLELVKRRSGTRTLSYR